MKRNSSLINFKLDFSFKSLINRSSSSTSSKSNAAEDKDHISNKPDNTKNAGGWDTPYVKIDTIYGDREDQDSQRSTMTLGNNSRQSQGSLLASHQSPSKAGGSLSPYLSISSSPNLRRSSTSDIIKPEGNAAPVTPGSVQPATENRRPSTSSLLRKARERKDVIGGGAKCLSTPTAGRARSAALGQRRKSMAAF